MIDHPPSPGLLRSAFAAFLLSALAACGGRDVDTSEKLARAEAAAQRAEQAADRAERAASSAQSSVVAENADDSADPSQQDEGQDQSRGDQAAPDDPDGSADNG